MDNESSPNFACNIKQIWKQFAYLHLRNLFLEIDYKTS